MFIYGLEIFVGRRFAISFELGMLCRTKEKKTKKKDKITSRNCNHHPGFNNQYISKTSTPLSVDYDNILFSMFSKTDNVCNNTGILFVNANLNTLRKETKRLKDTTT